jgi:hypothetical protein
MDEDGRELLRRLFVAAAERLESAHEAAIAGQSGDLDVEDCAHAANRLRAAAEAVATLADAAMVIALPGPDNGRDSGRNRPR